MEIRLLPSSLLSKAVRKYEYGIIKRVGEKIVFTSLQGNSKEIKEFKDIEGQDGKPFSMGRILKMKGNKGAEARIKDGNEYSYIYVKLSGIKDKEFIERMKERGEELGLEIDGRKLNERNVVLFSKEPVIYENWKVFLEECQPIERYDMSKKDKVLKQAKEERLERQGKRKVEKLVGSRKEEVRDWNTKQKEERLAKEKASEGDYIVDAEIVNKTSNGLVRVGFVIVHKKEKYQKEISISQAKKMCANGDIMNMRLDEEGEFVGVGMYMNNLRQEVVS